MSEPTGSSGRRPRLYNRLSLLRYEAGLSRRELGEALGVSAPAIRSIERNGMEPGLVLAWRISGYFGLPLELIFSEEPLPSVTEALSRRAGGSGDQAHEHSCCVGEEGCS